MAEQTKPPPPAAMAASVEQSKLLVRDVIGLVAVAVSDSKGQRVTRQTKLSGAQAAADAASKPASK